MASLRVRVAAVVAVGGGLAAQQDARLPDGVTSPLSPAESRATMRLAPGFRIELVAAEPLLREPVKCAWDADGRLFVVEMQTYMQDIDGTGTDAAKGTVAVLTDTDGDGVMDKRTEFAGGLVLPRMLLPLDDRVLVGETYTTDLWMYRDADRDGVADGRVRVREGKADHRNLEHQDSALTWGIDNWIYTAMSGERLRLLGDELRSEPVSSEFAQWGLAVDDTGRQFFSSAGGERPAYGFQRHPRYGRASLPGELAEGFTAVWPIVATPDVQGGEGRQRPDGSLNHFTGCCGQTIFRGDALGDDCVGDYFLPEPVGRLVRRAKVRDVDGRIEIASAYDGVEFLAAADMNFRPIWSATGPDGCLYLVDMYRGIIQEGNWVKEDSYLRPVVARLGLDKNIGRGRIWRIVAEGRTPGPAPRLLRAKTQDLVATLGHRNGWWRDTAQKLLVLRGDAAAVPSLRALLRAGAPLARVHALWTLEGLSALDRALVATALEDQDPRVRAAAIRAGEPFLDDDAHLAALAPLARDADVQVAIQLVLSLRFSTKPRARELILAAMLHRAECEALRAAGNDSLAYGRAEVVGGASPLSAEDLRRVQAGKTHYAQLCIACHGVDGRGVQAGPMALAPSLVDSPRVAGSDEAVIRILLHGMTGPVDGKTYLGGVMLPQAAQDDAYLAAVLTYVRTLFGKGASPIREADVAAVRKATAGRSTFWTQPELAAFAPIPVEAMQSWKATASHGDGSASRALDGDAGTRFSTDTPMRDGMWWQVEFDAPYELHRVVLDTRGSAKDYPRGYVAEVSNDGQEWREVARGEGDAPITSVRFAPTLCRWLRVRQTGEAKDWYWSIHELSLFGTRRE